MIGGDTARFSSVVIDSRNAKASDFFVAIRGERFDGHDFVESVTESGGRGFLIRRDKIAELPISEWRDKGIACVAVVDTRRALGDMAAYRRKTAGIPVVAITGSNGKTSTKDMTASVLGQRFNTLSTAGNLNNDIGVPLTLLRLSPDHQAAVVEMGMNHPGEIRRLSAICRPNIGMITNIAPAHLEGLGGIEAVAAAKGELLENITPDGVAVLNADNVHGMRLKDQATGRVLLFGLGDAADVRADKIIQHEDGIAFNLHLPDAEISVKLHVHGRFMVYNALAAAAAGNLLGVSAAEIKDGLAAFKPVKGRMSICRTDRGVSVVDDSYNANPGSMEAAISVLSAMPKQGRSVLVAGDMRELGSAAGELHERIGRIAARSGIDRLYITGENADDMARGAIIEGMAADRIFVGTKPDIMAELNDFLDVGDWVLVKGSRSMGMEEIVEWLLAEGGHRPVSETPGGTR